MAGPRQPTLKTGEPTTIIREFANAMLYNGRSIKTIKPRISTLTRINKLCDITNPYEVKDTLSKLKWQNSTKKTAVTSYTEFLKFINKTWERPTYKKVDKIPFIPTEEELDILISAVGRQNVATTTNTKGNRQQE